eukprot:GILI01038771.1.p1 GENE.GILI01038771.1~~GILI01038771.1.p1  ORF type:complete len:283 (+),score=52.92 GILI01038771.1:80-850(+)
MASTVARSDDSGSTIDPPFMAQRTTCDQCTIYNYNFWCPVDFSCYTPSSNDTSNIHPGTQADIRAKCNAYCSGVYLDNNPTASVSEAVAAGHCSDMQQCFYSADQCSDCTLSSGRWCNANRRCYAFSTRLDLPPRMNISTAPSEYICLEDCPDKSCITQEPECPSCERLRPPLTCGALLPAFILASTGAGFFACLIVWFFYSYYQRRKAASLLLKQAAQRKEQRLMAKRAGRAAGKGGNNMASLRLEPTQISYDEE